MGWQHSIGNNIMIKRIDQMNLQDLLPAVVAFVLIAIVASVGALVLANFQANPSVTSSNFQSTATSATVNAINFNSVNSIAVGLSGGGSTYPWITAATPLTISITGNVILNDASNTVLAKPGNAITETAVFISPPSGITSAFSANFYNISTVTMTGVAPQATGLIATITENYNGVVGSSAPAAFTVNALVATGTSTARGSTAYNATNYGLSGVGTLTSYLPLIALVIVAAILIGIVLVAFSFGGRGRESERY